MTAAGKILSTVIEGHPQMRAIRLPGDLRAIADLVELCFEATLDDDGRRFIRQMRLSGSKRGAYPGMSGLLTPVRGYVWVENGRIVGNINLIPVRIDGQRAYLIANVAVHPDHRRRGIASAMTEAALALAGARGVRRTALQVDADNLEAQSLYRAYSFVEKARRTVWHTSASVELKLPPSVKVRERRRMDWRKQRTWLGKLYDRHVRWNLPYDPNMIAPGVIGWLLRNLGQYQFRQWSALHHNRWIGSLTWQSSYTQADWLWLAAPPDKLELATCALIPHARRALLEQNLIRPGRQLAVNFPAGVNQQAFEAVGFETHNTLIWMEREQ
jgi:ribosomal protein S18 acetylase RimI-like enzyme